MTLYSTVVIIFPRQPARFSFFRSEICSLEWREHILRYCSLMSCLASVKHGTDSCMIMQKHFLLAAHLIVDVMLSQCEARRRHLRVDAVGELHEACAETGTT